MSTDWGRRKFLDFPLEEYRDRLQKFRAFMEEKGIDGAVLTQMETVIYFTGFRTDLFGSKYWCQGMGVVISLDHDPVVFTTTVDMGPARTLCWMDEANIREWSPAGRARGFEFNSGESLILSIVAELNLERKTIGFETGLATRMTMPYDQFQRILSALPNAEIRDISDAVMKTREIKSEAEIDRIRGACHITDLAIQTAWKTLDENWRAGLTQVELEKECATTMAAAGGKIFFFNCWSGPPYMDMSNGATLPIKIKRDDIVNIDLGTVYRGYVSDFMRIAFIGGEPRKEWGDMLSVLRDAQAATIELLRPGARGEDLERVCTDIIKKAGYYEDYIFAGHGIGMEPHELPRINDAVFQTGMVTTVEPAIFPARRLKGAPDAPGFWVEEVVVITDNGHEIISNYDPEPYIVE